MCLCVCVWGEDQVIAVSSTPWTVQLINHLVLGILTSTVTNMSAATEKTGHKCNCLWFHPHLCHYWISQHGYSQYQCYHRAPGEQDIKRKSSVTTSPQSSIEFLLSFFLPSTSYWLLMRERIDALPSSLSLRVDLVSKRQWEEMGDWQRMGNNERERCKGN